MPKSLRLARPALVMGMALAVSHCGLIDSKHKAAPAAAANASGDATKGPGPAVSGESASLRLVEPTVPMDGQDGARFTISLIAAAGGAPVTRSFPYAPGSAANIDAVPVGSYLLTVSVVSSAGADLYVSDAQPVEVKANAVAQATVTLKPAKATGGIVVKTLPPDPPEPLPPVVDDVCLASKIPVAEEMACLIGTYTCTFTPESATAAPTIAVGECGPGFVQRELIQRLCQTGVALGRADFDKGVSCVATPPHICRPVECAAPPPGYLYANPLSDTNGCSTSCGKLVANPVECPLLEVACVRPPAGMHYEPVKNSVGCSVGCGKLTPN